MIHRSRYRITRWRDAVILEDKDAGRSVTNDADRVVRDLVELGIDVDEVVIVYRDTAGQWDQMLTRRGEFFRFWSLPRSVKNGRDAAMVARRK